MQTIKYLGSKFWILQFNMILNAAEYWQCRIQSYWYDPVSVRFNPFPMSALLYFANQPAGKGHNLLTTRLHLSVSSMRILFKLINLYWFQESTIDVLGQSWYAFGMVWISIWYGEHIHHMVWISRIWIWYGMNISRIWIYPGNDYIQEMNISRKWIWYDGELTK